MCNGHRCIKVFSSVKLTRKLCVNGRTVVVDLVAKHAHFDLRSNKSFSVRIIVDRIFLGFTIQIFAGSSKRISDQGVSFANLERSGPERLVF